VPKSSVLSVSLTMLPPLVMPPVAVNRPVTPNVPPVDTLSVTVTPSTYRLRQRTPVVPKSSVLSVSDTMFDPDVRLHSGFQDYFWWTDYITGFLSERNKEIEKISKFIVDHYL